MNCETCAKLENAIKLAKKVRDAEKERIMKLLLEGHQRETCTDHALYRQLWRDARVR